MREVKVRAVYPILALVDVLFARGGDFDAHVAALAEFLGGFVWPLAQAQRQPWKHGLIVTASGERLEIHMDEKEALMIGQLAHLPDVRTAQ
jgi:hypothetical protein